MFTLADFMLPEFDLIFLMSKKSTNKTCIRENLTSRANADP